MIVNGDDFGKDDATNRGIITAFERGLISSTTLMANHPGFDAATDLAHELRIEAHVGVHLVLTAGRPLTDGIRRLERFCDADGNFRTWNVDSRSWRVAGRERELLARELEAQIERVRLAKFPVTHVDSHHQVHNEWGVGGCVVAVCKRLDVPWVRIARNSGAGIKVARRAYKWFFNARLRRSGLARTQRFGAVEDWLHLWREDPGSVTLDDFELMTHPKLTSDGRLTDSVSRAELAQALAPVVGVDAATSYSGARRAGASIEPAS